MAALSTIEHHLFFMGVAMSALSDNLRVLRAGNARNRRVAIRIQGGNYARGRAKSIIQKSRPKRPQGKPILSNVPGEVRAVPGPAGSGQEDRQGSGS